jgi:hypothetical protein
LYFSETLPGSIGRTEMHQFKITKHMKRQIKKWTLRLTATVLLITGLMLIIVLNPILTYASKTTQNNITVFHNSTIDPTILSRLADANELLKASEFHNPNLHFDICLNDGSKYPEFMRAIRGQAFAWGFYDKVVLQGTANYTDNFVELNGYKWNLTQLVAHEMTHCLQFDKLGFWKSNPIANIPDWKWEGYAEYVSRQNNDQKDLSYNLDRLIVSDKSNWEVTFDDGTIAPREYYEYWTLVKYCIDIKSMTYQELLADTMSDETVRQEMMSWYQQNKNEHAASY